MTIHTGKKMPPAQAIVYAIEGARDALVFLKELEAEWKERREKQQDGSLVRRRQRIVADAFAVYIASLFDKTNGTHSLVRSYLPHPFIEDFRKKEVVKKCIKHRHNRAGHQSEKYGFVVPLDLILSSDIDAWLGEALYAVATKQLPVNEAKQP